MRKCIGCKYHEFHPELWEHICLHPNNSNPVTDYNNCLMERSAGACGPDGNMWEAKKA